MRGIVNLCLHQHTYKGLVESGFRWEVLEVV